MHLPCTPGDVMLHGVQLLKLGAPVYLPSLSRYYLLWDMDMIALRAPRLWVTPPRRVGVSEPRRV